MGSFVFVQAFSFWTYHVLLIWFGVTVGPYPIWIFVFKNVGLWLPIGLAFFVKFMMGHCIHKRVLADTKPYHRGIKFPVAYTIFDTLYSMLGAILGWASALTRIGTSFFTTLLLLPRLDLALPGASLDNSHSTFLGVMETSRQRIEFQQMITAAEEDKWNNRTEEGDDTVHVQSPLEGVELVIKDDNEMKETDKGVRRGKNNQGAVGIKSMSKEEVDRRSRKDMVKNRSKPSLTNKK